MLARFARSGSQSHPPLKILDPPMLPMIGEAKATKGRTSTESDLSMASSIRGRSLMPTNYDRIVVLQKEVEDRDWSGDDWS